MAFTVFIADDHKLIRDGIRALLERLGEFQVVGEASDGAETIRKVRETQPQLVILDVEMPGLSGIDAIPELLQIRPDLKVIILSMYDDEDFVLRAMRSGARGFVLKSSSGEELIEALRTIARGGSYLSPQVSDVFLKRIQEGDLQARNIHPALASLTPRELQILRLVAQGYTSKDIANTLNLGVETVRSYRKTIMRKTGINNIAGLTRLALSTGLLRTKTEYTQIKEG